MTTMGKVRIAALIAIAAASAPAIAADSSGMVDYVRVNRAAVTPSTPREATRALGRLELAAMEACGASFFSLHEQKEAVRHSECWHDSMTDVVARIDNQYLTAAFQRGRGTVEVADSQGGSSTHAR